MGPARLAYGQAGATVAVERLYDALGYGSSCGKQQTKGARQGPRGENSSETTVALAPLQTHSHGTL
jgi:hypothetical protein